MQDLITRTVYNLHVFTDPTEVLRRIGAQLLHENHATGQVIGLNGLEAVFALDDPPEILRQKLGELDAQPGLLPSALYLRELVARLVVERDGQEAELALGPGLSIRFHAAEAEPC